MYKTIVVCFIKTKAPPCTRNMSKYHLVSLNLGISLHETMYLESNCFYRASIWSFKNAGRVRKNIHHLFPSEIKLIVALVLFNAQDLLFVNPDFKISFDSGQRDVDGHIMRRALAKHVGE